MDMPANLQPMMLGEITATTDALRQAEPRPDADGYDKQRHAPQRPRPQHAYKTRNERSLIRRT